MVRVKSFWLLLGLLFSLIACSQTVSVTIETPTPAISATPFVAGTETTLPSPTPWVGGIETALAAFTPATPDQSVLPTFPSPATIEKPTDFSPVLYGGNLYQSTRFLLLGGVSRETWLAPDMSVARFSSESTYGLHSFTHEAKYLSWQRLLHSLQLAKSISLAQVRRWMNLVLSASSMAGLSRSAP